MTDLITIVVPIYKVELYLKKCIDSILAQTYENLEIILVPQPGGDICESICREYEKIDDRIVVLPQTFCDLSHARNIGIENGKGKYIAFIDSDDMINEKYIEILYDLMKSNVAEIVQCASYAFIDEKNIENRIDKDMIDVYSGKEMCYTLFENVYGTDSGVIQTKLYKLSLFEKIKFPEGRLNEDGATNYRLYWNAKKIVVTGKKLYYYRSKRSGSIIHTVGDKLYRDSVLSARECKEFYKILEEEYLYIQALYVFCNAVVRARITVQEQKLILELKQEQREALSILIKSDKLGIVKKILSIIGYVNPLFWGMIWTLRNMGREFYEWKIKGVRK